MPDGYGREQLRCETILRQKLREVPHSTRKAVGFDIPEYRSLRYQTLGRDGELVLEPIQQPMEPRAIVREQLALVLQEVRRGEETHLPMLTLNSLVDGKTKMACHFLVPLLRSLRSLIAILQMSY